MNSIILAYAGKQKDIKRGIKDYNVGNNATISVTGMLRGGASNSDEVKAACQRMEAQVQHISAALAHEQSNTEDSKANAREETCADI